MRVTVEVPTVEIQVSVPEHISVDAWRWQRVETMESREYVYTGDELRTVLGAYGAVVGLVLRGPLFKKAFRLTAEGLFTGRFLGEYHLMWSPALGSFMPREPPTVLWPKYAELPEAVRRGAILHSGLPRLTAVS